MCAKIRIHNLNVEAIVGIHDREREKAQLLTIHIEIVYDINQAVKTDNISQAVDYEQMCQSITRDVRSSKFYLIETLAAHILDIIMADTRIQKGLVRVIKPNALSTASAVEVEFEKKR